MRGHLNGNSLRRIDPTGKVGLRKNRYLGDRTRPGGAWLGDREWEEAVRAGVKPEVGGELGRAAGGPAWEEAKMGAGVRPDDFCCSGIALQLPG